MQRNIIIIKKSIVIMKYDENCMRFMMIYCAKYSLLDTFHSSWLFSYLCGMMQSNIAHKIGIQTKNILLLEKVNLMIQKIIGSVLGAMTCFYNEYLIENRNSFYNKI